MPWRLLLIGSLGYFVDILDLFLFSVLRVPSLKAMGLSDPDVLRFGVWVLNSQMFGLLLGGIWWGVRADRKGRLNSLYGSILLYSVATFANAFVTNVPMYCVLRFFAGLGLAGELGAAVTLVTEATSASQRGWGTTLIAAVGFLGGIVAALMGGSMSWKTCYMVGGLMGVLLLLLRLQLRESVLFAALPTSVKRGSLLLLFSDRRRIRNYLCLILAGSPIWFVAGILMVFSPEFGRALGIVEPIRASTVILVSYIGVALGDVLCGVLSQVLSNRRHAVSIFLLLVGVFSLLYLRGVATTATAFYWICALLGIGTGYWAVLITMSAEAFGTNLRATVATTVPNFVRASVIPLTALFQALRVHFSMASAATLTLALCWTLAIVALFALPETFGRELEYLE